MKTRRAASFVLALLPAIALGYSTDAEACGMSVRMEQAPKRPTPVQEIARAEKALEGGQNLTAAQTILRTIPRVRHVVAAQNPLETRALRVFALAIVRSDGSIDSAEWTRNANLAWAVQSLREIDQKRPNDPTVQADLGEALSKTSAGQGEALTILQGLAQKDLMGSPHAYAALAKLRTQRGDSTGAEAAIKRCEEMSKTPGVCRPAAPSSPSSKPSVAAKA